MTTTDDARARIHALDDPAEAVRGVGHTLAEAYDLVAVFGRAALDLSSAEADRVIADVRAMVRDGDAPTFGRAAAALRTRIGGAEALTDYARRIARGLAARVTDVAGLRVARKHACTGIASDGFPCCREERHAGNCYSVEQS